MHCLIDVGAMPDICVLNWNVRMSGMAQIIDCQIDML